MDKYIFSAIISIATAFFLKWPTILLMEKHNFISENYSGKRIVNGGGLFFLFPCLLGILPFWNPGIVIDLLIYCNIVFSMLLMGIIDDFLGQRGIKGFKGHLKMLFNGQLTTGILKIFIGVLIGLAASASLYTSISDIIFHAILFALCVNLINLMDVRPGRAIKAFILITGSVIIASGFQNIWMLLPVSLAIIIYIRGEMKEIYMLGDTGSNLLGGLIGLYIITIQQIHIKLIIFMLVIILQMIGEFYSLSKVINAVPWLRYIDKIGGLKKER